MQKIVTTCDHCGKELDEMKDYVDVEFDALYWFRTDLCSECYAEISQIIKQFCQKE